MNEKMHTAENGTAASNGGAHGMHAAQRDLAVLSLRGTVADEAREVGSEVKHLAGDVAHEARHTAAKQLTMGKERAAEGLGTVARALRQTGRSLAEEDDTGVTHYIAQAADQVDSLSDYLRDRSFSELVTDVERFARREPALFLGGAFVAGLLGGRFLKSSRPRKLDTHMDIRDEKVRDGASAREHGDGTRGANGVHDTHQTHQTNQTNQTHGGSGNQAATSGGPASARAPGSSGSASPPPAAFPGAFTLPPIAPVAYVPPIRRDSSAPKPAALPPIDGAKKTPGAL